MEDLSNNNFWYSHYQKQKGLFWGSIALNAILLLATSYMFYTQPHEIEVSEAEVQLCMNNFLVLRTGYTGYNSLDLWRSNFSPEVRKEVSRRLKTAVQ